MTAALDAESVTAPGVFVEGRAKVVSKQRIEVTMKIINRSERITLGAIRPLYCHQYRDARRLPPVGRELRAHLRPARRRS